MYSKCWLGGINTLFDMPTLWLTVLKDPSATKNLKLFNSDCLCIHFRYEPVTMVYIVPKYIKNYAGMELFQHEIEKIRFPLAELMSHVTIKTTEMSILGAMAGGTIQAMSSGATRNWNGIQYQVARWARFMPLAGLALGPVMTLGFYFSKGLSRDELYDRCYRLRHNKGELRRDRAAFVGLGAGGLFSVYTWGCPYFACTFGMTLVMGLVGFWQHMGWFDNKLP